MRRRQQPQQRKQPTKAGAGDHRESEAVLTKKKTTTSTIMVLCSARPSTLLWFHRVLALLILIELVQRRTATRLLYSINSVGARGYSLCSIVDQLMDMDLDSVEWHPIGAIGAASAVAAFITGAWLPMAALLGMYVSLSLRSATFMWILDRYAHTLLVLSVLLPRSTQPRGRAWRGTVTRTHEPQLSSGVVALARLQVCWIYVDAAMVKWRSGAWWQSEATDLSALDVYLRHTHGSAFFRFLAASMPMGEEATLRWLSSATVVLELGAPVLLLFSCFCHARTRQRVAGGALALLASLHVAIAATMSGTVLLSALAALALLLWLDVAIPHEELANEQDTSGNIAETALTLPHGRKRTYLLGMILMACVAYETSAPMSTTPIPTNPTIDADLNVAAADATPGAVAGAAASSLTTSTLDSEQLYSEQLRETLRVLLGNRWNVFGPAAPYATWEITPGKLADGSVAEVWRASQAVSWAIPGPGQTLWHDRYRMLPFLSANATDTGEAGGRFWDAVCNEWDRRQPPERRLVGFRFFMLHAPLLSRGRSGTVSKMLVRAHVCPTGRVG